MSTTVTYDPGHEASSRLGLAYRTLMEADRELRQVILRVGRLKDETAAHDLLGYVLAAHDLVTDTLADVGGDLGHAVEVLAGGDER